MDDRSSTVESDTVVINISPSKNQDILDEGAPPTKPIDEKASPHHQKRKAKQEEAPPAKRSTIHRIVRGWATTTKTNDDTVDEAQPPPPPEPNTEPPPSDTTDIIQLQVFGAASSSSLSNLECLLLEMGWGCRRCVTTVNDDNNNNNNIIAFDCVKRVSYDTKHTYQVHIRALEENYSLNNGVGNDAITSSQYGGKKFHRHIMCVPLVSDEYISKATPPGPHSTVNDNDQQLNQDFWNDLQSRIRFGKAFVDDNNNSTFDNSLLLPLQVLPPASVSLIILIQLPPPSQITFSTCTSSDDILQTVQSKSFHDQLSSLCQELQIDAKYYTPVLEHIGSKPPLPPTTTDASNDIQKSSSMEWWWKPQYTIDYCFESIIQKIVKEEKEVVLASVMTTGVPEMKEHPISEIIENSVDENYGVDIQKATDDVVASVSESLIDITSTAAAASTVNSGTSSTKDTKKKSPHKRARKITPLVAAVRTSNMNHNQKRTRH